MVALLLIAVFLMQTFNRYFIVADYYTRTKAYTSICENQNKPQVHCNGRCQLLKRLKQEDAKDRHNPNRKANQQDELVFIRLLSACTQSVKLCTNTLYLRFTIFLPSVCSAGIFHPPQV